MMRATLRRIFWGRNTYSPTTVNSLLVALACTATTSACTESSPPPICNNDLVPADIVPSPQPSEYGKYLFTIGVCEACHTPPAVSEVPNPANLDKEREYRTDPDWYKYLDPNKRLAGGVPFIIRLSGSSHGVVYSSNITPDDETGLGQWTDQEIIEVIRTGKRKDGTALFLFAPHTFFKDLAMEDLSALVSYLRSMPPIKNAILPRSLPFEPQPAVASGMETAPKGRSRERAEYLLSALVGCEECHSHRDKDMKLIEFAGGNPADPFIGVFRFGPDLPLRQMERGFAAFPYPGYAILYGGNLTRFGIGGDLNSVPSEDIVKAVRNGISTVLDDYGRPRPLAHSMLWQFYASMSDDDAYSIVDYIRTLQFIKNDIGPRLIHYGDDWRAAFEKVFGEPPTPEDEIAFGK